MTTEVPPATGPHAVLTGAAQRVRRPGGPAHHDLRIVDNITRSGADHRAAGTAAETGHRLPGGGMTGQRETRADPT